MLFCGGGGGGGRHCVELLERVACNDMLPCVRVFATLVELIAVGLKRKLIVLIKTCTLSCDRRIEFCTHVCNTYSRASLANGLLECHAYITNATSLEPESV